MNFLDFLEKLKHVKVLITDVDGVWTKGQISYADNELEIKEFYVKDGLAIKKLIEIGIEVVVVTARYSEAVQRRCRELGIQNVFQGIRNKMEIVNRWLEKYSAKEIAYIGDDLPDLEPLKAVGVGLTVFNAASSLKKVADYVTNACGGEGAIREVVDLIVSSQEL